VTQTLEKSPEAWKDSAGRVSLDIRPFISGEYRPSTTDERFEDINPANEEPLAEGPVGSAADIDAAVRAARRRFEDGSWSEASPVHRAEVLLRLADLIVEHREEIALLDSLEMGKPIRAALWDAENFAASALRTSAGFADKLFGETAPIIPGRLVFNVYEPRGVVGAITPWNFPIVNAIIKIGPALAAGNTVVLKPSELSPSSALKVAELAVEAGVPEGVLNVVPGLGSTVGAALALHEGVDFLSFTGSTATGSKIMEACGRSNSKPLILECGGKSPQVVFGDVERLDAVAAATVENVLWNTGQVCSAHSRLVVQKEIKEALLEQVVGLASAHQPGEPLDEQTTLGPLASPAQRDRVRGYVEQGLKAGAVPVLEGRIQESGGCYIAPTVFDNVDPTMAIVREEIFGPVLVVQEFETEQEALRLANGTPYGLDGTVWTRDSGRARRMAHGIKAASVSVRSGGEEGPDLGIELSYEPQKASGFGAEAGPGGLQSYSTLKFIQISGA
jgi:acyl-CoA reductase-like NAD-dependent aldehyde dehydrogenase